MVSNTSKVSPPASLNSKDGKIKKSRNRIPTSCSVCRRRKMKCDRAKPFCGSCVANDTVSICNYSQQPWEYLSTEKQLSNEVVRLKFRINELERAMRDQQMVSPPESFSTQGSSGNESEDPFIDLGVRFDKLVIKENKLVHYGTTSYLGLQANDPYLLAMYRKFFLKHAQLYHEKQESIQNNTPMTPVDPVEQANQRNNDVICWTSRPADIRGFEKDYTEEASKILAPVNKVLPQYEIMILFFEYFFEKGYPLFSFIDESLFREDVQQILFKNDKGQAQFILKAASQLAVVAMSLLVMRVAYLLLPVEDFYIDQARVNGITALKLCASNVNITPFYVSLAQDCFHNMPGYDSAMKKVTLVNIQVLLFLRLYKTFSPEDGDEGPEPSILMSMLIQMCRIHGVYRDPQAFQDVVKDYRVRHLWRKIWYKVLQADASQAILNGSPLIINDDQWDCALPSMKAADIEYIESFRSPANRKNNLAYDPKEFNRLFAEQKIIEGYEVEYKVTSMMREVVQLTHNMKVTPRRSDFVKMIAKIESASKYVMESYDELIRDKNNDKIHFQVLNIKKCAAKSNIHLLLYILSYLLLLSSEDEDDVNENFNNLYAEDNEYLVKATESSLLLFKFAYDALVFQTEDELSCTDTNSYKRMKQFFGVYDKLMASDILLGAQRSLQFLCSITMRFGVNCFSFTSMVRSFSNSEDSVQVLRWFNISIHNLDSNVDVSLDKQFSIMLYQYIKIFYTKCLLLKDKFFFCLRLNMLIKIFINHFKIYYPDAYKELNGQYHFTKIDNEDGLESNMERIENAKNFSFDNEDVLMSELLYRNEDEFLNQILNDPVFLAHSLAVNEKTRMEDPVESIEGTFSAPFEFSNNPLSPVNQMSPANMMSELFSFKTSGTS